MDEDPEYTARCNAVTLQSNDRGFFLEWAAQIRESSEAPASLPAHDEKACLLACLRPAAPILNNVQSLYRPKCEKVSAQRRAEGERALITSGPSRRALALHSQAVTRAPPGLCLASALASRSETLLQLSEHEAALTDIRLAIREGFTPQLRYELYWRMGRCYRGLGQIPQARVSLQLAQKLLQEAGPTLDTVAASVHLQNELDQLDDLPLNETADTKMTESSSPSLTGGENPELPGASSYIAIQSNLEVGRYAVAKENIATGDTLVVEPAYASCLLPDKFGTHCHHCFKRLLAPIGCPDCSGVAFCSVACRDTALKSYHRYECHFMDLLIGSGMSILCHLALRIITQSGLKYFLDIRPKLDSLKAETYAEVYNLITLTERRSPDDLLHRTLMALFLLRILQSGNFFNTATSKDWSQLDDEELYIGSLLLHHLQLLQFNAHEIFETCIEAPDKFQNGRLNYIAVGLYPTVAKFNHDCHPAVARFFVGKTIVLQALHPIKPGEEIPENYGPVFTKRTLVSRQRTLASRYWFKCTCQACRENWPTYDTLSNESLRLRCSRCAHLMPIRGAKKKQLRCPKCKQQLEQLMADVAQCENLFEKGMEAMQSADVQLATQLFSSYLDTMYKVGSPPHREMSLAQDALRICLSNSGNTWVILN